MKAKVREELLRQVARAVSTFDQNAEQAQVVFDTNLPQLTTDDHFRMLIAATYNFDRLVVFTKKDDHWAFETSLRPR